MSKSTVNIGAFPLVDSAKVQIKNRARKDYLRPSPVLPCFRPCFVFRALCLPKNPFFAPCFYPVFALLPHGAGQWVKGAGSRGLTP